MRLLRLLLLTAMAASGQCILTQGTSLHLGPTGTDRLRSTGDVKMIFLFVDFSDAPGNEDAQQIFQNLAPVAERWVDEVSASRAKLTITAVPQWFRMPKASAAYNFAGLTFQLHRTYISDALLAADSVVNFSQFDGVYIIPSRNAQVPSSAAFIANPGAGVTVDGIEIRQVVTLAADLRQPAPNYRHDISHETGHLWGLPDLYLYAPGQENARSRAGSWDNMGNVFFGAHFTAWHKRKLGWLVASEFDCVSDQTKYVELAPVEGTTGIRGVAVQTAPGKAIVAEVRRPLGQDARLCDQGLLVYTVDSQVAQGSGPLVVQRAAQDTDAARVQQCGPAYSAAFNITGGRPSVFRDSATGVSFEILGATAAGGMHIRVSNPAGRATPDSPIISSVIGAGAFGALQTIAPGGWVELFGQGFTASNRSWASADFNGTRAPEALDGVRVFIGGKPAYIAYVSPAQVNAQVPDGIAAGALTLVLTNGSKASNSLQVNAASRAPGLLSPPSFSGGGKQYVAAILTDGAFVGPPGLIPGANFRRVRAGETVVLYGVGFGNTSPSFPAGVIVDQSAQLGNVEVRLGGVRSQLDFAGLVANLLGLYQFNLVVPSGGTGGDVSLAMTVDGVPVQTGLTLAVQ